MTTPMDTTVPARQPWEQPETPMSRALAEIARLKTALGMALAAAEYFQAEWKQAIKNNDVIQCAACGSQEEGFVIHHKSYCPIVKHFLAMDAASRSL